MNVTEILHTYSIPTNLTVHHAIANVSEMLDCVPENKYMSTANALISDLGGQTTDDPVRARLYAKALVEQAFLHPTDYDPQQAFTIATEKVDKIVERIPFLFKEKKETFKESADRVERSASDKRTKALAIWKANPTLGPGECARLISKELGITYSNAYYYTSRVFGK